MMKKIVWILILALLLSGCSTIGLGEAAPEEPVQPETVPEPPSAPTPEKEPETAPVPEEPAFPAVVLMNRLGAAVTLIGYTPDDPWGPTMLLELKNETDRPLRFATDGVLANGVMCDPYWSCDVPAGETVQSRVRWSSEQLALSGIAWLNALSIRLLVTDPAAPEERPIFSDAVELTLEGGEGSPLSEAHWADFPGQVLAEGDGFRVTTKYFDADGDQGPALTLQLVNSSDRALLFTVLDVTVNGKPADPFWGEEVVPHATRYSQMIWESDAAFRSISMTLCVYDGEDWEAEDLFCETVTIDLRNAIY